METNKQQRPERCARAGRSIDEHAAGSARAEVVQLLARAVLQILVEGRTLAIRATQPPIEITNPD